MCGNWAHHTMADDGSWESWLDRWRAACDDGQADVLMGMLEECGGETRLGLEGLSSAHTTAGFMVACEAGRVDLLRGLLGLEGKLAVDVHADFEGVPEGGFVLACVHGHVGVVRELLALSGEREVDVQARFRGMTDVGFRMACGNGHAEVVRELLALSGHREVDVHAWELTGPDAGFRFACQGEHIDVVRELLGLTGHRAIPLQTRLDAGEVAVQPAKDASWAGTSTRRGREAVVLLRVSQRA